MAVVVGGSGGYETPGFNPWVGKTPGGGQGNQQRSLAGYRPWGHKESDMTEQLSMA